jgi:hypothetical protein
MLEAAGYPGKDGALASTAKHLKVPHQTLRRWFLSEQNPPPSVLVREKRGELSELLRNEVEGIFCQMPNVREEASYRDLGTVAGILIDKLQLITGKPTERSEINDTGLTDEDRANRITAILDRARERRDRQAMENNSE